MAKWIDTLAPLITGIIISWLAFLFFKKQTKFVAFHSLKLKRIQTLYAYLLNLNIAYKEFVTSRDELTLLNSIDKLEETIKAFEKFYFENKIIFGKSLSIRAEQIIRINEKNVSVLISEKNKIDMNNQLYGEPNPDYLLESEEDIIVDLIKNITVKINYHKNQKLRMEFINKCQRAYNKITK